MGFARGWLDDVSIRNLRGRQEKHLAVGLVILSLGTGLSSSMLSLYLLRHAGVSATALGVAWSVAAMLGIASGPVMGHLADRLDGYLLYAVLVWIMCVATASLTIAPAFVALMLISVLMACGRGSAAVLAALIGRAVSEDRRVFYRAVAKSWANAATVIGLGLGALVLALGSKAAFQIGFLAEAATLFVAGLLVRSASVGAPARQSSPSSNLQVGASLSRFAVLKDRGFVALTLTNSVLMLYVSLLTLALPLWISSRMQAPLWLTSVAMVINTVGVLLLQIPASRKVTDVRSAAIMGRRGGLLFALSVAMFPIALLNDHLAAQIACVGVLALFLVAGEVLYSAASWELVYGLAPDSALGQYQGVFSAGLDVSLMVAPILFTGLVAAQSMTGWAVVALAFAGAASLITPIANRLYLSRQVAAASVSRQAL
ncbi:MAG: putative arabinose efflux permease, family [Actinomycetota bacterium]|nr:putative arabinose efflux permease, family [Actinomycetota bacterium]